jgi:hypothetical protein
MGEGVEAFFRNFPSTASLEEVREERLQPNGRVRRSLHQRVQYLSLMTTDHRDLAFQEYRKRLGVSSVPSDLTEGFMLTAGFTSASIRFHPEYQSESAFRHLGRQRIDGHEAFVVGFAQRPGTARLSGTFRSGETSVSTFDQGLAWVDSTSYQIVRMRTDLLRPVAKVRLERVTTDTHFGEVHFIQSPLTVWLPREVTVTVEWNGRLLRNTHTYSEFKLFNVESSQKQKAPGNAVESIR